MRSGNAAEIETRYVINNRRHHVCLVWSILADYSSYILSTRKQVFTKNQKNCTTKGDKVFWKGRGVGDRIVIESIPEANVKQTQDHTMPVKEQDEKKSGIMHESVSG
jgi:hypothetical protein